MHVQLTFRSKPELQRNLKQMLDFTSQRSEFDPQTSQPTQDDEAACHRYEQSKYVSERWKCTGCKIHEDIESIEDRVEEYLDELDGYYIHP